MAIIVSQIGDVIPMGAARLAGVMWKQLVIDVLEAGSLRARARPPSSLQLLLKLPMVEVARALLPARQRW